MNARDIETEFPSDNVASDITTAWALPKPTEPSKVTCSTYWDTRVCEVSHMHGSGVVKVGDCTLTRQQLADLMTVLDFALDELDELG